VVLSTVIDAHDRDFHGLVLADGTTHPQSDVHDFLIEKIYPHQARVITIADPSALSSAE
jgi:nicotinamidase-related amidase